jgi:hypothetical protein
VAFTSAGRVTNTDDGKDSSLNNNPLSYQQREHVIQKRAWNQLQSNGWGKRSFDEEPTEEEIEEIQRIILRNYADQLSRVEDNEYIPNDMSEGYEPLEKRAWNQMNSAWGKREWNQLRGNGWGKRENAKWSQLQGGWGKRADKWSKLSSAWGRK